MNRFETIVLGLGAMGSAAVHHLAKKGNAVLGIDRFAPPHVQGSTHGGSRITRLAVGEGEQYSPLAIRSHQLWRELEMETGTSLLTITGGLILSSRARTAKTHVEHFFANTLAAARRYGISHELLDAEQIRRRFPPFKVADDEQGYFEHDAGFVRPEECVRVQLMLAERHGAKLNRNERVTAFDASDNGVSVTTERATYAADRLIVSAGPWLPELIGPELARHFKVYRQVMFWFDIDGPVTPFLPANWPVFIWELQGKKQGIYGMPAVDGPTGGLKIATEQFDAVTSPEEAARDCSSISEREINAMYDDYVAPYFSGLSGKCVRAASCLYTATPDFGFVIDAHPQWKRVLIASPCSGHGFKHSAAIGEALSELVIDGASRIDLDSFALRRLHA